MQYYGNFTVNNGTSLTECRKGNNKYDLLKDLKCMAMGERFGGNTASWWIKDENDELVFEAKYTPNVGTQYSVYNYKSMW